VLSGHKAFQRDRSPLGSDDGGNGVPQEEQKNEGIQEPAPQTARDPEQKVAHDPDEQGGVQQMS
jgi:hypothetical protein